MTKEELLTPRYKVIADYPRSTYVVGEIINKNQIGKETQLPYYKYPAIFQPLKWWEDRKLFDLPRYVKCIKAPDQKIMPGMILKVAWYSENWGNDHVNTVILDTDCYEPATEEEYENYLNQNK